MKKSKVFPLERILTISASDYCASVGRNLTDYTLRGVIYEGKNQDKWLIDNFRSCIPSETEVIVGFRFAYGGVGAAYAYSDELQTGRFKHLDLRSMASGTALIRKNNN